ncbi:MULTISPECIES: hypothetical protein [Vibrio]|uniref:Uncharacterized protein n=2 Tax=Vibrio TaxID=662 RepID=A0A510IEQ9_9VIBR|nr:MULTISPECIES: hypothetical protein [Vibrio]RTZ24600.1 hypothetical protein EKN09_02780 [Vibrio penaeicida]BBL92284.1 hypothetical protein VroAM7_49370 [Vibrio rotiferianus]GLQ71101.1 hypothetical protein GCM10007932_04610 [Vibrio penaeicida]
MNMKRSSGRKNRKYLTPKNQKVPFKKLVSVTSIANELAGIQYHNDQENQMAIKEGNRVHLVHTLHNDVLAIVLLLIVFAVFSVIILKVIS